MSWSEKYLGVPYVEKGRDMTGWDCWGLVRHVLYIEQGLRLPSYTEDYATSDDYEEIAALMQGEVASRWTVVPLAQAQPFDAVILRMFGYPVHFGLVVTPPLFLHTLRRVGTWVDRWDCLMWQQRIIGAARWTKSD